MLALLPGGLRLTKLKAIRFDASPKGDTGMKRTTAIALIAMANFVLAGTSFAQSKIVRVNVPFDFTVGKQLLPAGTYTIKAESSGLIAIRNHDKPLAVLTIADQDGARSPKGGKVMFHKYGDQYFLSEILCDQAEMNLELPTSKTEKRAQIQQATLKSSSQTVVAAQ